MASEQPVKKKLRITDEDENRDEPDFLHNPDNIMRTDLSRLHLTLPPTTDSSNVSQTLPASYSGDPSSAVSGGDVGPLSTNSYQNGVNLSLRPGFSVTQTVPKQVNVPPPPSQATMVTDSWYSNIHNPSIGQSNISVYNNVSWTHRVNFSGDAVISCPLPPAEEQQHDEIVNLQNSLIKQCLCGVSESTLRKPFETQQRPDGNGMRTATLSEWPVPKALQFLSNLQLLFDVYLKQNNKGHICSRICDICDIIVRNEHNLIDQIIDLASVRNKYINYLSARVLSSFLILAKTSINNEWLETIVNYLAMEPVDYIKMNFSLEVIKRVVEWKDVDIHVLEESESQDGASTSRLQEMDTTIETNSSCSKVTFTDHESFDTSGIKGLIIKSLESKWPSLIKNIQLLIMQNQSTQSQNCVLTFLSLWESIISVKANLSVVDTKPFYAHLENFVMLLNHSLPPIVWRQLLSLFNEVLCYGSTLALQDLLPEETCALAHLIVRYVKDFRLLDSLPYRRNEGQTVNSFVGTIATSEPSQPTTDKTLLQKMVLLVLKSVAITVKETRCDSSDSSIGSDDYDFYQDMQLIERSIRDVLKKVDVFIKNSLEFHPETTFSKILIHLFSDQDDYMIESMVCTLDITVGIYYRNSVFPDLIAMLNPSYTFVEFLKIVTHDSDVLLDYLVSNETCFLLYLLRYLKYIRRNWSSFVVSCETINGSSVARSTNELDETMTVLIRLRHQISRLVNKQLFPYNINPVLRLLEMCESLYEGNELS
ncbi:lines [Carabus blaptoides fortunei]